MNTNMEIKARDLIAAGWHEGKRLGPALRRARELEASGLPRAHMLAQLEAEFPKQLIVALPRHEPAPLAEAIEAETPEEIANVELARQRMRELLTMPVVQRGVIMPDACPSGPQRACIPVGGAIAVENAIIPGAHSSDICCSMFATFFPANHPTQEIMDHLFKLTHFGAGGRRRGEQWTSPVLDEPVWENRFLKNLRSRAQDFMGTQGDGNHFAYVGRIQFSDTQRAALESAGYTELAGWIARRDGEFNVLVTHHGSRGLGADLFKRGHVAARKWCDENAKDVPDSAAWLAADSPEGRDYWDALQYIARWTRENHAQIHAALLRRLGQRALAQIGNEHNFVWKRGDIFMHGKGATPAWRDAQGRPLLGLIPLNMAREILLVLGADNDDYLSFCPHGAGRNLSRSAMLRGYRDADGELDPARVQQTLAETTAGLDIRWHNGAPDLSESPLGYKDATKVKAQIERFGLATVVGEIQPRGCIMAGEAPEPHWMRARREKREAHKAQRREGDAEAVNEAG
ncbi:tRNA-splicing ligase RtcB [Ereboglobus sp. PH5-5]|uniref:RtcB family protein n=1 Tax=Ereboglobus sp. PH5-5 TaxID=2940529 RepID=UPI0024059595|nr:RtcB family protein [Ereboglobus sp. PH5-5]MDF9832792.1 tRNA-splicing ligase RtcB [Ereboglobus sp. PH5-5]